MFHAKAKLKSEKSKHKPLVFKLGTQKNIENGHLLI